MNLLKETKQILLSRTKYDILLEHNQEKTPSKEDLIDKITSFLKKDKELTIIDKILTKPGSPTSNLIIYVYDSKKDLEDSKPKKKDGKKKNKKQKSK